MCETSEDGVEFVYGQHTCSLMGIPGSSAEYGNSQAHSIEIWGGAEAVGKRAAMGGGIADAKELVMVLARQLETHGPSKSIVLQLAAIM